MTSLLLIAPVAEVYTYAGVAIAVGIALLCIVYFPLKRWFGSRPSFKELIGHIGIGFIVAGIVTIAYEGAARSMSERQEAIDAINRILGVTVTKEVWGEINREIFHSGTHRRNVDIKFKLLRGQLLDGERIGLPEGQAVLWIEYSYDLYALTSGSSKTTVEHALDYEMWNERLRLPRFEELTVSKPGKAELDKYDGSKLAAIFDTETGSVRLKDVELPPPSEGIPVRVTTKRYEIVNTPGEYNLVMPVLIAKEPDKNTPTIRISIETPDDIESELTTYYAGHKFKSDPDNKNTWIFDGIMLPGQGFSILFKTRHSSSTSPTNSAKPSS